MNLHIFAGHLRDHRNASGITQAEVARHLNVTPQTVSKWERGLCAPDLDNLIELAALLDVSVDELIRADAQVIRSFAAIDGGGTKTEFLLFTEEGHIQRRLLRGSTNPNVVGGDTARANLTDGLDALIAGTRLSGIFAGIAGSATSGNAELLTGAIASRVGSVPVRVGSDILNVIHSVRGVDHCIAVICGTGSSVFAWDGKALHRYGGWGYLFDGAGSGYDIGCDILRECFALADGFGRTSLVTELAEQQLGCPAYDRLEDFYSGGRDIVAALAPIAFQACREGDEAARAILMRNFSRIASLIRAADNGSDTVILSGGLTCHRDVIEPMLADMLPPNMRLIFPELPQIYGSALAAMKFCGCTPADPDVFDKHFTEEYNQIRKES